MEFFTAGVNLLQTIVYLLGAGTMIAGLVEIGRAQSENNPSVRNMGIGMFFGGVVIFAVGATLIPKLSGMISF